MTSKMMNALRVAAPALFLALPAAAAQNPQIEVEEVILSNGMTWLLYENHDSPTVMAGWTAHVGSVNERPGITGISHFFEHMMFKGTPTIGTTDIETDLELIAEQERVREQMRGEMEVMRARLRRGEIEDLSSPENWTQRYRELNAEFDDLVKRQREVIVKDEMDRIYTRNGGEFMNAGTTEDLTLYFIRVPSNRLELWAWLESDRLLNPVFREFYSERDVVFEERRMRTESTPLGKYDEAFNAVFWEAHPYSWPVVGWASDIPMYTLAQAKEYFATYYAPNNITGVLAGSFRAEEIKPLLERYFGRIPRGETDPPPVVTLEPEQIGEKRYNAEAETSPTVRIWWKGVPFVHRDTPALDLLADVMAGRTGRLYKGLVDGRKIANQVSASNDSKKYDGIFQVEVTVKDEVDPPAVEAAIKEEIGRLQGESVPPEELQKVKNRYKAFAYRRLSSPTSIGIQLLFYAGLGDWRHINTSAAAIEAVTAEDIQRVAKEYLTREKRTVGVFLRKEGAAPEDPEVAALPPQAQPMVRQALGQIESEADPAQLQQMIGQMQQAAGQAPPEMKPAIDLILKRATERLEALGDAQASEEGSK
jgi:predicted Zn-dependent peptidase